MLLLQVEAVTRKMDENRTEYETRLQEFAQLLDIRAARIRVREILQIIQAGYS